MPLPAALGAMMGGTGVSPASSSASGEATGGVQDTTSSAAFNFAPGGSGVSNQTLVVLGVVAAAALALVLLLRRK